jgi:nucleotide-binding universal stress UspA family protein
MQRFRRVLLALDQRGDAGAAIEEAIRLVTDNDGHLIVLETVDPRGRGGQTPLELRAGFEASFAPLAARVKSASLVVSPQDLVSAILAEQERDACDLVIGSAPKGSWLRRWTGTDDRLRLMRKSKTPVWLVPTEASGRPDGPVVAAINPANRARESLALQRKILDLAGDLAAERPGRLKVLHCWQAFGDRVLTSKASGEEICDHRLRAREVARLQARLLLREAGLNPDKVDLDLFEGPAACNVPQYAAREEAGVVVMGTVARTGFAGLLLGNTAESVLPTLGCSILTVRFRASGSAEARSVA